MRKLLMLLVFTCCCTRLFAQWPAEYKTRDSIIDKAIYGLRQKNIDTIAIYSLHTNLLYFISNYTPNYSDPCSSKETFLIFILWKNKGKTFFTFKTSCYDYPDKLTQDDGLWRYYIANRLAIENNQPKEPWLKHVDLQTEQVTFGKERSSYKETETTQYIIITGNNKIIKNWGYRLYQQFGNGGDQNLNYKYNLSLPAKQLHLKLEALCKKLVNSIELTLH